MNAVIKKTIPEWRLERGDRARGGMSQMELAAAAGLHLSTVAVTETGATRPSFDTMQAIARALGVSVDQIILPPYKGTQRDAQRATRKRRARRARPTHPPKAAHADDGSGGGDADGGAERDGDPDDGDDPKADARRAA